MLNTVTADNAADFNFALSDGTPVTFREITSKNNIKVKIPSSHYLADEDDVRIFFRNGDHYKGDTDGITLVATQKAPVVTDFIVVNGALYQRINGTVSVA